MEENLFGIMRTEKRAFASVPWCLDTSPVGTDSTRCQSFGDARDRMLFFSVLPKNYDGCRISKRAKASRDDNEILCPAMPACCLPRISASHHQA
jgi:hypothetical protein